MEGVLFLISATVCWRLLNGRRDKWTWNWIAFYWAVLCVKNAMGVLHD